MDYQVFVSSSNERIRILALDISSRVLGGARYIYVGTVLSAITFINTMIPRTLRMN